MVSQQQYGYFTSRKITITMFKKYTYDNGHCSFLMLKKLEIQSKYQMIEG